MPSPNKPTPEELKQAEDEAIKLADELEAQNAQSLTQAEDPEEEERARKEAEGEVTPVVLPEDEPKEEDKQAEPSEEEKEALRKKLEAEKKKSSASARENQKINAKNRVINQALIDAEEVVDPTEEELIKEFPDWDVLSEMERTLAKETVISRNWRQSISKAKESATKIEKWNDSVEEYIDNPETLQDIPALEGKTDEFKTFAQKEENNSVPFKTLVGAFLYEHSTESKPHKGRMFENGSGGPNDKPQVKSNKISLAESRVIRQTDYARWKELNRQGLIDYDV